MLPDQTGGDVPQLGLRLGELDTVSQSREDANRHAAPAYAWIKRSGRIDRIRDIDVHRLRYVQRPIVEVE
jgi:hypothetical protein